MANIAPVPFSGILADVKREIFALAAALAIGWNAPVQGFSEPVGQAAVAQPASPAPTSLPEGEKGLQLLNQGRYQEAVPQLHQAVKLAPDSWKYSLGLAEALLSANYNFSGLRFIEEIYPRFHNLTEYHYTLGLADYLCFRYIQAIKEFQSISRDDPKFHHITFLIGNCYMAMGDLRQAETLFRRAIEQKPDEPSYYASLGKMLRMEGPERLDEATSVLKKAWDLNPHDAYVGLHLAYCHEGKGDYSEAQTVLEQVAQEQPDFQPAHLALADVYEHSHEPDKARRQREIAARLKPPPPIRHPGLGPVASNFASN